MGVACWGYSRWYGFAVTIRHAAISYCHRVLAVWSWERVKNKEGVAKEEAKSIELSEVGRGPILLGPKFMVRY